MTSLPLSLPCDGVTARAGKRHGVQQCTIADIEGVRVSDVLSQIDTEEIVAWLEANTDVRMVRMTATY